ncbi:MAG: YqaJ viral recombinase family protein [Gemmatimonadetes bacterium]|nr:YqaJ viral recombinase family protein [Gemmatimonadota bacterium]
MLTAEQMVRRAQGITATDVVALCGLSRYRSPLDVYLEKKGQRPSTTSVPARIGNRLEPVICELYAEERPDVALREVGTLAHPDIAWALATPDREVLAGDDAWLLEAKSRSYRTAVEFGEPGTDQVPPDVLAQVHWQLFVTGKARCDVAVLVDAHDFRVYQVAADAEATGMLFAVAEDFWLGHVLRDVPPRVDGSASAHEFLAERFRTHTDELTLATPEQEEWIAWLRETRARLKELELAESKLVAQLKEAIGERAGLVSAAGHKITWKATRDSEVVDWKAFALACNRPSLQPQFTSLKPGVRRFLPTWADGGK